MKSPAKLVLGLCSVLVLCADGNAQSRPRVESNQTATPATVVRVRAPHSAAGHDFTHIPLRPRVDFSTGTSAISFAPISGSPGLGFDFTHAAAVNRNSAVRSLIDPLTQHQVALARSLQREAPAFPLILPAFITPVTVNIVQPPPVVIVEQSAEPMAAQPVFRLGPEREPDRALAPPAFAPAPPPREVGEFVLVRRDGRVLFVVAFSVQRGRVVYVTPEGLRRFLPLEELDAETTSLLNEHRGTAVSFPS